MEFASKEAMRLRVILLDLVPDRSFLIEEALGERGCDVVARLGAGDDIIGAIRRHEPDVILADMEVPDRDVLESMRRVSQHQPKPIALFANRSDETTAVEAVRAGVSAYVVDGLAPHRLKPVLNVAIARFKQFQAMRQELDQARARLADRRDIDRAKGLLMKKKNLDEEQAYALLRNLAMKRGMRLGEMARNLLSLSDLLD